MMKDPMLHDFYCLTKIRPMAHVFHAPPKKSRCALLDVEDLLYFQCLALGRNLRLADAAAGLHFGQVWCIHINSAEVGIAPCSTVQTDISFS